MLVVSYLHQLLLPKLVDAVRDIGAEHVHTQAWGGVEEVVRRKLVGVMVLDPYADCTGQAHEVARLLHDFPSTPVIAYTQFIPPALRTLTQLAQQGLHETVLFQFDDSRARFGRLLVRASTYSLVQRMLQALQRERNALPPVIAGAVDDLFKRPHAYGSGRDLVLTSQTPLTSLYRALMQAGFVPPKQLFVAARLLHAAGYLHDPGYTVQQVAEKTGYLHPRVLTQHTLAVFGVRPSGMRTIPESHVLTTLVDLSRLAKGLQGLALV